MDSRNHNSPHILIYGVKDVGLRVRDQGSIERGNAGICAVWCFEVVFSLMAMWGLIGCLTQVRRNEKGSDVGRSSLMRGLMVGW